MTYSEARKQAESSGNKKFLIFKYGDNNYGWCTYRSPLGNWVIFREDPELKLAESYPNPQVTNYHDLS